MVTSPDNRDKRSRVHDGTTASFFHVRTEHATRERAITGIRISGKSEVMIDNI